MAWGTNLSGDGMLKSLWIKFLLLLLSVAFIALSSALLLRELMVRDFRSYLDGEQEDNVYSLTADLESAYQTRGAWPPDAVQRNMVWALKLGFETRLLDRNGDVVMDTARALRALPPAARQKVQEVSALRSQETEGPFLPYPLFSGGKEIGTLEVRPLQPKREPVFIKRSNTFLVIALGIVGGFAVFLSIIFSQKLTRPLKTLASVAAGISEGDLSRRVAVRNRDELGRLADSFNRMAHTLETQESLRKKLISNITHELRTPLTAMQGEIEGMMDGLIPANNQQLQSLHEETNRLKKMIDGMEELAQAQASALTLKKRQVALKPFLETILERFRTQIAGKEIAVALVCDEATTADVDPDRASQIVINLLSNSIKSIEKKGAITLSAVQQEAETLLEVKDTGVGIREDEMPFIFERFYRGAAGGLGLGLAIVRELVDAHGGRIEVKSTFGMGTVFSVYFPG